MAPAAERAMADVRDARLPRQAGRPVRARALGAVEAIRLRQQPVEADYVAEGMRRVAARADEELGGDERAVGQAADSGPFARGGRDHLTGLQVLELQRVDHPPAS